MPTTSRVPSPVSAAPAGSTSAGATRAWGGLLQVHAGLVPVLDRELQVAAGLPLAWYDVLLELNDAPQRRLRMSELGDRVVLSRTRVSRLVDEMATSRLVQREAHPTDRRSAYAVITDTGRRALRTAAPVYLRGIQAHFGRHASQEELAVIADVLWRVHEAEKADTAVRSDDA